MKDDDCSTIEGCIRQSQDLPVKPDVKVMHYVDDEMLLISTFEHDHEFIKWKQEQHDGSSTTDS